MRGKHANTKALSSGLYEDGYKFVTNIDFSPVLIDKMSLEHSDKPEMKWLVGDVRKLPFKDSTFDVAIDKGTMDAMLTEKGDVWNPSEQAKADCKAEVDEVVRVLSPGGVFLYWTFGQPHFRKPHLVREGWDIQVIEIGEAFHYYLYVMRRTTDPVPPTDTDGDAN